MKITIAIADDHQLFLKSLRALVNSFSSFEVILDALNGEDLINRLSFLLKPPDILLLDVDMPEMNSVKTTRMVLDKYPLLKIVALSIKEDDAIIINMIKAGCCAYLPKDVHPDELEKALMEIHTRGYYNSDVSNIHYRRLAANANHDHLLTLTQQEKAFLHLACSDLSYKQIASEMKLAERTIDSYRDVLFQKLNVQSRAGMTLEAIRKNLISP